jgi:dynein heavy chain
MAEGESKTYEMDDQSLEQISQWICKNVQLSLNIDFEVGEIVLSEDQKDNIYSFLTLPDSCRLISYATAEGIAFQLDMVNLPENEPFVYFLRPRGVPLTTENFAHSLQFGCNRGRQTVDTVFQTMKSLYIPSTIEASTWPAPVKKEFTRAVHKFMASLTEAVNHSSGKTILYIPQERITDAEKAAKDKDLVQLLESTVIHWTRQIKEVITNHDSVKNAETAGPLDEIEFWRFRTVDLSGISDQLSTPEVCRILAVLAASKSSYLEPFMKEAEQIEIGCAEANDNLKFLKVLHDSCTELSQAEPKDVPLILPGLLLHVRMIWSISKYYNTKDRLTSLLRKVSNELIRRCCVVISLKDIFEGDVDRAISQLQNSISCGVSWKKIYQRTKAAIAKHTPDASRHWDFDDANIFAQIDAFVQRCRDLSEVCESQIQFSRRALAIRMADGDIKAGTTAYPVFCGQSAPDIIQNLMDIEKSFIVHVSKLQTVTYDVLDVKATKWHEDFNQFKTAVKDLEVMLQNVINGTFDNILSVVEGVHELESFFSLAKREAIVRCVENKGTYLFDLFLKQIEVVKTEFEARRKHPPLLADEPQFSGAGLWTYGLLQWIEFQFNALDGVEFLPKSREAIEATAQFEDLKKALEESVHKHYADWMSSMQGASGNDLHKLLENPLLVRHDGEGGFMVKNANGLLKSNFDDKLVRIFAEVRHWEKFQGEMRFVIPYVAHDISNQQDKLRLVRQHVLQVVREYNDILEALGKDERKLFQEHIRRLDRRISPGFSKLNWTARDVTDYFVKESRRHCQDMMRVVSSFQVTKADIASKIKGISRSLLLDLQKNRVYSATEFEKAQNVHLDKMGKFLRDEMKAITQGLKTMYQFFQLDPKHIQAQWAAYTKTVNDEISAAFHSMVLRSIKELSRTINGDSKTEPIVLFQVHLLLEEKEMVYNPTMPQLAQLVQTSADNIMQNIQGIEVIKVMAPKKALQKPKISGSRRLQQQKALEDAKDTADSAGDDSESKIIVASDSTVTSGVIEEGETKIVPETFYDAISQDREITKLRMHIQQGVKKGATLVQKYTTEWLKYKEIYHTDKDQFIQDYEVKVIAVAEDPLAKFDMDIAQFKGQQALIQVEGVIHTIDFIKIDCSLLRSSLVHHCIQWQNKHTELLNKRCRKELEDLHAMLAENTKKLTEKPKDLDHLSDSMMLLRNLQDSVAETEGSFPGLEAQYELLQKFEVRVSDKEQQLLQRVHGAWLEFKKMLAGAERMLQASMREMRREIEDAHRDCETRGASVYEASRTGLPFGKDQTVDKALEQIDNFKNKVAAARKQIKDLGPGLQIFKMEEPDAKMLDQVEEDLAALSNVWGIAKSWDIKWTDWKTGEFRDLDCDFLEREAAVVFKTVSKLGRTMKKWRCWQMMKDKIDEFRATLPLILNLRNNAMRDRHWEHLCSELGKTIDPHSSDFTLEQVFELGLHHHGDFISELSSVANKELAIEENLAAIASAWKEIDIEIGAYKDKYYKVVTTEDLFSQLEDNAVALSTMKASRFYSTFKQNVDYWENTLATMSEVVEMILIVQRQWMYLESIFMGSEDIRKQLPTESLLFDRVNDNWINIMNAVHAKPNAVVATQADGILDSLNGTNDDLERIQKSLDQYLETKRQLFPRFYFLSNDDLLEILGQQKDPGQVQKHIKKCFEAIRQLQMIQPGKQGNKHMEAAGMNSPDGEKVSFNTNVIVQGAVELWLIEVENHMIACLQRLLRETLKNYPKNNRSQKEKWVKEWPGQHLILAGKIMWTSACTRACEQVAKGNKKAIKKLKRKQVKYLTELSDFVRGKLTRVERKKLVALITMEIHSRDVMERMIRQNAKSADDFVWLSQQRFYFMKDEGDDGFGRCRVKQTSTELEFGYEYQGNNGRLVVTPLTDRCVLTLTTALHLQRGGNPLGPAGTGKTETVKDLGKNLAKYVVVFNCSDGLDFKSVGRMFSGLVQSGGWGCFDEFNRIEIEVLSVVAAQILSIMNAISQRKTEFIFEGIKIRCRWSCGIFVTMNPGYAGRTELPDNLKSLMRPVAMMVPDLGQIAEVMLMAEGFRDARILGKKSVTLYALMVDQLSKQSHYDYGMRSLKAVLGAAGALKREDPDLSEDLIVLRALKDMNVPKFIKADYKLFLLLLGDLFPGLELPVPDYGILQQAIEDELDKQGLLNHPFTINKTIQLYESKGMRHCNMLVGSTQAGKSTAWKTLQAAKTTLCKVHKARGYQPVQVFVLNPKGITMNELYGTYDLATMEWSDGTLSTIFRKCAQDEKRDEKWIMLDGPVDTLWIESMNTVMDDNKTLTLINGERISMSNQMSLLFEVLTLDVASPATVSRAGMVYLDVEDLGWKPYTHTWIHKNFEDKELIEFYQSLFEKYVGPLLDFVAREVKELVSQNQNSAVHSLCRLFSTFNSEAYGLDWEGSKDTYFPTAEKIFSFCLVWSIGASATAEGRKKFDHKMREVEAQFPPSDTIYDYFYDEKSRDFRPWADGIPKTWRPNRDAQFFDMIVPTLDTVRNSSIINRLLNNSIPTLVVGNTGTGKSVITNQCLLGLPDKYTALTMFFSAATTAGITQDVIEGNMEKRAKGKYGPPGGKQLVTFIDDLNMPTKDTFGSQGALELLRQWMDYGGWYDRSKCTWQLILDMQVVAAMGPPGGGRSEISERTQSRFNMLNFPFPADNEVVRIFETLLSLHFADFDDEIKPMGKGIASATLSLYKQVVTKFLPTPKKCHYLFNMRDIAKVVQGIRMSNRHGFLTSDSVLRLWCHELLCVFSDRLATLADQDHFRKLVDQALAEGFGVSWDNMMQDCKVVEAGPIFTNFMTEPDVNSGKQFYEEVVGDNYGKLKAQVEEVLDDYNVEPGYVPMDLVLFEMAVRIVCKLSRVLSQPRGNFMLVGVGGSGRQSLTKLASFQAGYSVFMIEITKRYSTVEFHEDIKRLFKICGVENKPTVFLFNDTQVKEESFLEDVNNILSSGEVPNLFLEEDLPEIYDGVREEGKNQGLITPAELWDFFIGRVRKNLHVVVCMSPVGDAFRNRCRMFPGLVNCTTILWFHGWPAEALTEVALKFLEGVELGGVEVAQKLGKIFAVVHQSVQAASEKMLSEHKRNNYVTPTHYLELVKGYSGILNTKRKEMGAQLKKLSDGVAKLDEGREQVEVMSVELSAKQEIVNEKQKECEKMVVDIMSEKRIADDQKQQVEADEQRINKEALECKAISDDAQRDLAVALPALEQAMLEVDKLDKSSISEVKAYTSPPPLVQLCLEAVMLLFHTKTDWASAKKKIGESSFLVQVKTYDKDNVAPKILSKLQKYIRNPSFQAESVKKVSAAAGALCVWVHAINLYANVSKEVAPKRAALKKAQDALAIKQASLQEAQTKLAKLMAQLQKLNDQYKASTDEKEALKAEASMLEAKLIRADNLVKGLAGEKIRWSESVGTYRQGIENTLGDALLASGSRSYLGPFDTQYRASLLKIWFKSVEESQCAYSKDFTFSGFLSNPTNVRDWNIQGLPVDAYSTENGVIVTQCERWPLMIDPQAQANKWIKKMEGKQLKVTDFSAKDFLRQLENAITFGAPYLLQDVEEELDPSIAPVLNKSLLKVGTREVIRLGDKDLDWSKDFRMYLTTKLANPHYPPEISTKTTIVNFSVKEEGLEAQLLGIVVQKEEPALEVQKSKLVVEVASGKRKIIELEDLILQMLSETQGSLLEDENLVITLQESKETSTAVKKKLKVAEVTEKKIDEARSGYKPISIRAAILYFILNDLARVDPMYQFSLSAYSDLFTQSIANSRTKAGGVPDISKRIDAVNNYHTYAVYKQTCLGLFEKHKLLLSFNICTKILQSNGKLPSTEFDFFLKGALNVDREEQKENPCQDWLLPATWDNVTVLDKLESFQGIASSFDQFPRDWEDWYLQECPELVPLPGEWQNRLNEFQRMCILRSLRIDRVGFAAARFVSNNMEDGSKFVEPPPFDLMGIYKSSNNLIPLVFVLSPGVDPTAQVFGLGDKLGVKCTTVALGQGQAPNAIKQIDDGVSKGNFVFLANCHLMLSWLGELEKIILDFPSRKPHENFRLWLSSNPTPKFPISILQNGIKMTTEPPRGLRANLLRLYNLTNEDKFSAPHELQKFKKLRFALCWFHAILLERRKFKTLGFNIPYDFNDSDFLICEDLLALYLDEFPDKTPWEALRYLTAEANYGGRVTDSWDRRLVNVYINEFYCDEVIEVPRYQLSSLSAYFIPSDGNLDSYKSVIGDLPNVDKPDAFGQHPNADISSQIDDANTLLQTIVDLQPLAATTDGGPSNEDKVLDLVRDLMVKFPKPFDLEKVSNSLQASQDAAPLLSVCKQEIDRYNSLLKALQRTLTSLELGVQGLVVITSELEEIFNSLLLGRVPSAWGFCYPSLKALAPWVDELVLRMEQMNNWINNGFPVSLWLSGLTYPTGMLTALLQTSSRKNGIAIDTLSWEFPILPHGDIAALTGAPEEGTYVHGMFLEGARWEADSACLTDATPMQLNSPMPIVHFKPIEGKKRTKGMYVCPLYLYPIRTGTRERPSFMTEVDLKSGSHDATFWTKRGTALLLSLAT